MLGYVVDLSLIGYLFKFCKLIYDRVLKNLLSTERPIIFIKSPFSSSYYSSLSNQEVSDDINNYMYFIYDILEKIHPEKKPKAPATPKSIKTFSLNEALAPDAEEKLFEQSPVVIREMTGDAEILTLIIPIIDELKMGKDLREFRFGTKWTSIKLNHFFVKEPLLDQSLEIIIMSKHLIPKINKVLYIKNVLNKIDLELDENFDETEFTKYINLFKKYSIEYEVLLKKSVIDMLVAEWKDKYSENLSQYLEQEEIKQDILQLIMDISKKIKQGNR